MLARFFIDRPVFAWVIAIVIMLAGGVALVTLPVAQYPDIAPPSVMISASYPGASAESVENSVTQVLEEQLTGVDGLLYFSSSSDSSGNSSIQVTFQQGTNPDTAQIQVQNKLQQALTRLPVTVQSQGITVAKSLNDFLMIVGIYDESDRSSASDVSDYLVTNLQDPIARVNGVGGVRIFGAQYAMRIWLDPSKLAAYNLMPADVVAAIQAQNVQYPPARSGPCRRRSVSRSPRQCRRKRSCRRRKSSATSSSSTTRRARPCASAMLRAWRSAAKTTTRSRARAGTRLPGWRSGFRRAPTRSPRRSACARPSNNSSAACRRATESSIPRTARHSSGSRSRRWSRACSKPSPWSCS